MNRINSIAPWSFMELFLDQWMSLLFQRTFQPPTPNDHDSPPWLPELTTAPLPPSGPLHTASPPSSLPADPRLPRLPHAGPAAPAPAPTADGPQVPDAPTQPTAPAAAAGGGPASTQALDVDQLMALASGGGLSALTDLDDDFVKLIGFSIVSVQRGHERLVRAGSTVVAGPMQQESFESWMIAKYVGDIKAGEEKYLRVHYTIARRWPREPLHFEENQLKTLDGIRRALAGEPSSGLEKTTE